MDKIPTGNNLHQALKAHCGQNTVPVVYINGTKVGGCDDTKAAHGNGKLKQLLNDAGVENTL